MQTFLKHGSADGVCCACVCQSFMSPASVQHRTCVFMLLLFQLPMFKLLGHKQPVFEQQADLYC